MTVKIREPVDIEKKGEGIEGRQSFDNQFEVMGVLPQVNSSIKRNVTQDYTLAWLSEPERIFIQENYENASYIKKLIETYENKGFEYHWNEEKGDYERNDDRSYKKFPIEDVTKKKIDYIGMSLFEVYMILPHMIAILNRNRKDNFLVKLLGRDMTEDENKEKEEEMTLDKIKEKLKEKGEKE